MSNTLQTKLETNHLDLENRHLLKWSFLCSALWMIAGHAYFFFSDAFSFDSLLAIGSPDDSWKISLGRFAQPIYKNFVRGNISNPWLIGICSILFLSLAIYLLAKLFQLNSFWSILGISGILAVNLQVILTVASYVHEVDSFMLAFLLQVVAVYLWHLHLKSHLHQFVLWILGAVCIMFSLGLYQAYISTGVSFVMMVTLTDCYDKKKSIKSILLNVVIVILIFLVGCILYYFGVQFFSAARNIPLISDTNGMNNLFNYTDLSFLDILTQSYLGFLKFLFTDSSIYCTTLVKICNILLLLLILFSNLLLVRRHLDKFVITVILLAILPFGFTIIRLFNPYSFYELLIYAYFLYYVLGIVLVERAARIIRVEKVAKTGSVLSVILVLCVVMSNVRFANQVYLKKDLESEAFKLYMGEVFTAMDQVDGYIPGETNVLFLSSPKMEPLGYEFGSDFDVFTGLDTASFYATKNRFEWYVQFVMQKPIFFFADQEAIGRFRELEAVKNMPVYPAKGSMQIIEYVLVVNLSENQW